MEDHKITRHTVFRVKLAGMSFENVLKARIEVDTVLAGTVLGHSTSAGVKC